MIPGQPARQTTKSDESDENDKTMGCCLNRHEASFHGNRKPSKTKNNFSQKMQINCENECWIRYIKTEMSCGMPSTKGGSNKLSEPSV